LLRAQFADVAVLSFLEIPETKAVEIIATISGKNNAALLSDNSDYEKEE
jgi:flagellar biosynthesis protein FlhA